MAATAEAPAETVRRRILSSCCARGRRGGGRPRRLDYDRWRGAYVGPAERGPFRADALRDLPATTGFARRRVGDAPLPAHRGRVCRRARVVHLAPAGERIPPEEDFEAAFQRWLRTDKGRFETALWWADRPPGLPPRPEPGPAARPPEDLRTEHARAARDSPGRRCQSVVAARTLGLSRREPGLPLDCGRSLRGRDPASWA